MFLEIIGFFALMALLCFITLASALTALNCLGKYNIGGVPNSIPTKIATLFLLVVIAFAWYILFKNAPFTLMVN